MIFCHSHICPMNFVGPKLEHCVYLPCHGGEKLLDHWTQLFSWNCCYLQHHSVPGMQIALYFVFHHTLEPALMRNLYGFMSNQNLKTRHTLVWGNSPLAQQVYLEELSWKATFSSTLMAFQGPFVYIYYNPCLWTVCTIYECFINFKQKLLFTVIIELQLANSRMQNTFCCWVVLFHSDWSVGDWEKNNAVWAIWWQLFETIQPSSTWKLYSFQ